jgi:hypothetical protein
VWVATVPGCWTFGVCFAATFQENVVIIAELPIRPEAAMQIKIVVAVVKSKGCS